MVRLLLQWYEKEKRKLPWRDCNNPYYTWVSEIMLQQTRVEAVKPFFERFITKLPDIQSLASCEETELLKLWEGLGYYNRVRNMQKAAKCIEQEYDGRLPDDYEELKKLPGIGEYTAGAIASIGFQIPVAAVDGNVLRVWSRIKTCKEDVLKQSVKRMAKEELEEMIPLDAPGDFNQALMELGAVICLPNGSPRCERCPVAAYCKAYQEGEVLKYPVKMPKKKRKIEERTILVIQDGENVAIRKRKESGLLAGMYELPNLQGYLTEEQVLDKIEEYDLDPLFIEQLEPSKHIFSHIEWRMIGYRIRVSSLEEKKMGEFIFANQQKVEEIYPIPSAFATYSKYVNIRIGNKKI